VRVGHLLGRPGNLVLDVMVSEVLQADAGLPVTAEDLERGPPVIEPIPERLHRPRHRRKVHLGRRRQGHRRDHQRRGVQDEAQAPLAYPPRHGQPVKADRHGRHGRAALGQDDAGGTRDGGRHHHGRQPACPA